MIEDFVERRPGEGAKSRRWREARTGVSGGIDEGSGQGCSSGSARVASPELEAKVGW